MVASSGNQLIGIAGFHDTRGSLTSGITYAKLISQLGFFEGHWAAVILAFFERKPAENELLMDGIAVHSHHRGQGIGTKLLESIIDYAKDNGFSQIRLDVINTNPGARQLYERNDFIMIKEERFPYLQGFLGFSGSSTMILKL